MPILKSAVQRRMDKLREQEQRRSERQAARPERKGGPAAAQIFKKPTESEEKETAMNARVNLRSMSRDAMIDKFKTDRSGYEVRDHVLRHKKTLAAVGGTTIMTFFRESVGNNNVTLATTNMEENGKLPDHQDMLVEFIELRPLATDAVEANRLADLVELLNAGACLKLNYKGKDRFQDGPLLVFVHRTQLVGVDATSGDAVLPRYQLQNPIALPGGDNFDVTIEFPGGSPALNDDVELDVRLCGQLIEANRD